MEKANGSRNKSKRKKISDMGAGACTDLNSFKFLILSSQLENGGFNGLVNPLCSLIFTIQFSKFIP